MDFLQMFCMFSILWTNIMCPIAKNFNNWSNNRYEIGPHIISNPATLTRIVYCVTCDWNWHLKFDWEIIWLKRGNTQNTTQSTLPHMELIKLRKWVVVERVTTANCLMWGFLLQKHTYFHWFCKSHLRGKWVKKQLLPSKLNSNKTQEESD